MQKYCVVKTSREGWGLQYRKFKKVMCFKPDMEALNLIDEIILKDAVNMFIFFDVFKHLQAAFT